MPVTKYWTRMKSVPVMNRNIILFLIINNIDMDNNRN